MEEGEIASSSESEKDAQTGKVTELDEEAQIDRLQAEFAEELAKQLRQSTSQSDQSTKKLTQNGSVNATVEVPRKDTMTNHEVVSMEIESPEQEVEVDEAEQLRQLLLSQMKPKKNTANLTTKQTRQQPSISPHLPTSSPSPPSQIPPPPRPPLFLTSSDRRTSDYVSESDVTEKVVTRPTISISTTSIDTLNLTETPRSPDEVFDLQAFHDIETSEADTDDDLMDYELNLEKAKSEDQTRKNEIQRLVRRQKSNADEYGKVKKAVERAREELTALEKKLTYYADKGVRLNDQIFKLTERIFATQSKRLTATRSEREKWKRKLAHRSERSKDKLKHIKKIALSRPKHKPKVIPLNRVDTPPLPQTTPIAPVNSRLNNCSDLLAALPTLTKKAAKKRRQKLKKIQKKLENENTNKQPQNLAETLAVDQLQVVTGAEAELDLYTRMLKRKEEAKKTKDGETSSITPNNETTNNESPSNTNGSFTSTTSKQTAVVKPIIPTISSPLSLIEVTTHPLINSKSYKLFPSYPFEHIQHLSISNHINPEVPLCPYELHGICADPTCKMLHDRDLRLSEAEIICNILMACPILCPSNVLPAEYANHLLENSSVEAVARALSTMIPKHVREQSLHNELYG